jgi:5-methylcytosine-specific restriction endonuclease McrA
MMLNVIIKFCKKCQVETERNASSGCKPCAIKLSTIWAKENTERVKSRKVLYYAANSERIKEVSAAWYAANLERAKAYAAAYRKANPEKIKSSNAAWMKANPENVRASKAAWQKANPETIRIAHQNRRARKLANGGVLSKGLSAKLFKLQQGKCPCCNQPLGDDYHMDHIMPLKRGGANEDWNIQLLRQQCNNQKSAKDPIEFMQSRGKLL